MSFNLKSGFLSASLCCFLSLTQPLYAAELYRLEIARAPLALALQQLARQTGHTLLARADILPDIETVALTGKLTMSEALALLLANTDLHWQLEGKLLVVLPAPTTPSHAPSHAAITTVPVAKEPLPYETIQVRGYRERSGRYRQLQHLDTHGVELLDSEALLALPQTNLGDALSRLPGIVAERDNGATRQLGLRGLGANFVQVQVNGMASLASMNSIFDHRGSAERSRNFNFNVFDAALFSQVEVEKSYRVAQQEGGIAGTINLQAAKPLDLPEHQKSIQIGLTENTLVGRRSPRLAAKWSASTDTLGIWLAAAYSESLNYETGYRDWGWREQTIAESANGVIAPSAVSVTFASREQQRFGVNSSVQWRPLAQFELIFENLLATLSSTDYEYNLAHLQPRGLRQFALDKFNTLHFASYQQVDIRSEAKLAKVKTDYVNTRLAGTYKPDDRQQLSLAVGFSASVFESPVHDKIFLQAVAQPFSYDFRGAGPLPRLVYATDLSSPELWALHRADVREDRQGHRFLQVHLRYQYQLQPAQRLETGLQLKTFHSDGFERRDDLRELNSLKLPFQIDSKVRPLLQPFTLAAVEPTFASLLALQLPGRISGATFSRELTEQANRPGTAFDVTEETLAWYGQYQWRQQRWRGDIGWRWLNTRVESQGKDILAALAPEAGPASPMLGYRQHYQYGLPALSIAYDWDEQLRLSASASRNLALPTLSHLRVASDVSIADNRVEQGNPALRPFLATSLDFGLEYQGAASFFSLTAFGKRLDSTIVKATRLVPFAELGLPPALLTADRQGQLFSLAKPVNSKGGNIVGMELAGRYNLVPGVVLQANYTYATGNTEYWVNQQQLSAPLLYLSKHTVNLLLSYEQPQCGSRLAVSFRDRYLVDVDNSNGFVGVKPQTFVDAGVFYRFNAQSTLRLDLLNLTDEAITWFADLKAQRPLVHTRSGRSWQLAMEWQF